jgi:hypothetical protein
MAHNPRQKQEASACQAALGAAWSSAIDAEPELFSFIEGYYNPQTLHSRNGYRCPNGAEADWRLRSLAA